MCPAHYTEQMFATHYTEQSKQSVQKLLSFMKWQASRCHLPIYDDVEVSSFEQNSGLPLLKARRAHCYHPRIPHFEPSTPFNFALRGYSREGHRGKLWDPRRFHRYTMRHWPDWFLEYLLYWNSDELDDSYVWYGPPAVSFRVNHSPIIYRAYSSSF